MRNAKVKKKMDNDRVEKEIKQYIEGQVEENEKCGREGEEEKDGQ